MLNSVETSQAATLFCLEISSLKMPNFWEEGCEDFLCCFCLGNVNQFPVRVLVPNSEFKQQGVHSEGCVTQTLSLAFPTHHFCLLDQDLLGLKATVSFLF